MLKKIRKKIAKQFNFVLKFDSVEGGMYCAIYNAIRFISGDAGRIIYNKEHGFYKVIDNNAELFYCEKGRSRFYKEGVAERINYLGSNYFLDSIEFNDEDFIVDCGANIGEIYLYLKSKNKKIKYLAFEPAPREFDCLCHNVGKENATNMGLWHEDGTIDFFISSKGADSSVIEPKYFESIQKIKTKRLDECFNSKRIKLLKLEAEGAEPEVLQGAIGILDNVEYIAADLGFERGKAEESTFVPVANFLLSQGFELVHLNSKKFTALFKNIKAQHNNP